MKLVTATPLNDWIGKLNTFRDGASLRQQIALVAAGLCLISMIGAAIVASNIARQAALDDARQDLALIGRTMARTLDQAMFDRFREIRNISEMDFLRPVWTRDPHAIRNLVDQLQKRFPRYAWIGFAALDGTIVAATQSLLEGKSVAAHPWFINGLKAPTAEDVHKANRLDTMLQAPSDDGPFRFVDIAMPVRDQTGTVVGVLGAHMSWVWAQETRQKILGTNLAKEQLDIFVLSGDGTVLVGNDLLPNDTEFDQILSDVMAPDMLTAIVPTQGYGDYKGLGWQVVVRQPRDVATAKADQLVLVIVLIGAAIAVFAAVLAWFVSGTLSTPVLKLVEAVDAIGRDADETAVPRQNGSREVLQLSVAIRSLLRRLGVVEASEKSVQSRLREIQTEFTKRIQNSEERNRQLGADLRLLKSLAEEDPLSGLLNRRAFQPFADDAWATFMRHQRIFSVVVIDADHFKTVNDTHGHRAGDEVIRTIGRIIAEEIRTTDKAARFGGEEFVLLLRENDVSGAWVLAERIRLRIASEKTSVGAGTVSVTVSMGIAEVDITDRDVEDTIARADRALYAAKASGRNRVCTDLPATRSQYA